jgi:hypothetical protein
LRLADCRGCCRCLRRHWCCYDGWLGGNYWFLCWTYLLFARRCRSSHRRFHHDSAWWRSHNNHWTRRHSASRSLGHDSAGRRSRCNRRRSGRRNNGWRLARLRNNSARLRSSRRSGDSGPCAGWGWCACGRRGRSGVHHRRLNDRRCRLGWRVRMTRAFFLFVLLGQDRLQHIARLGDVRQIDLRNHSLTTRPCRTAGRMPGRLRALVKMRTNLLRFIPLQRAGVSLHAIDPEFRKNVDNRTRLHFQLACQIIDTNLTHPPLFSYSAAKPHSVFGSCLLESLQPGSLLQGRLTRSRLT